MRNISLVIERDSQVSEGCLLAIEKAPEFIAGGFRYVSIDSANGSVLSNPAAMAGIVARMREAHTEFVAGEMGTALLGFTFANTGSLKPL